METNLPADDLPDGPMKPDLEDYDLVEHEDGPLERDYRRTGAPLSAMSGSKVDPLVRAVKNGVTGERLIEPLPLPQFVRWSDRPVR